MNTESLGYCLDFVNTTVFMQELAAYFVVPEHAQTAFIQCFSNQWPLKVLYDIA